jgi:outer membrane protein OmpA-like peptidoglycan-associated protein
MQRAPQQQPSQQQPPQQQMQRQQPQQPQPGPREMRREAPRPGVTPPPPQAPSTPPAARPTPPAQPSVAPQAQPQRTPGTPPGAPGANDRRPGGPTPPTGPAAGPAPAPMNAPAMRPGQPGGPGQAGPQRIDQLRGERREERQGNRTLIRENDRTIVREGNREFIQRNELDRLRNGGRFNAGRFGGEVRMERRGNDFQNVIVRPGGVQIINVIDPNGHLLRRVRRGPDGREIVLIDNRPRGPGFFVQLPPPVIHMPRDRYIYEWRRDSPFDDVYGVLMAPPVEALERPYSLDEVLYSPAVRDRMPRVDLDTITFDTGSWEIAPDQMDQLAVIADALNRAIQQNPQEMFLIEGHTDAVGSDIDNLSLSDRRAEAVARALTEQFGVPPENLTSQGYGEQQLKIPTDGPERQNRRVAIRRITPLLEGQNR